MCLEQSHSKHKQKCGHFLTRTQNAHFCFVWFCACARPCDGSTPEISVMCAAFRFRLSVTLNSKSQGLTGCHATWRIAADRWWRLLLRAVESDHKDLMLHLSASPGVNSSLWNFQENQRPGRVCLSRCTHTHAKLTHAKYARAHTHTE